MDIKELISRINELAAKKKSAGLTDAELAEQTQLRRQYIDNIKSQVKSRLDCIEIADTVPAGGVADGENNLH